MKVNNFLNLRQQLDKLLSDHQITEARKLLSEIKVDEVPIKLRASFAKIARRANNYKLGVKFLQDRIYGGNDQEPEELLEYASCIRRLGLINQCHLQLDRLPESADKHLYKAFCYVQEWSYQDAQKEFEAFLQFPDLEEKNRMVALVNLISCLIFNGDLHRAESLLEKTIERCGTDFLHLYLNCLELRGRIHLENGEIEKACHHLDRASRIGERQSGNSDLFIRKWQLIAQCRKGEILPQSQEINEFQKLVRKEKNWETLRSMDWELARISKDFTIINHVYFGTPFRGFRAKIENELWDYHFPKKYIWMDRRPTQAVQNPVDLYRVEDLRIPFGMNLHRLLMILSSDFYKPWTVERIFNSLFSDEIYNPFSSPKKIYRLEEKLQTAIQQSGWAMKLESTINGYRLRATEGGFAYIHDKMNFSNQEEFVYHILTRSLDREFTLRDVEGIIPLSQHQWYRLLKKIEERGLINSVRDGNRTKYQMKAS